MNNDNILKLSDSYEQICINNLLKLSFIRKLPNGKYRVLSEKGRNLGTYTSKEEAKKRLKQIEFFKHKDKNKSSDSGKIDLGKNFIQERQVIGTATTGMGALTIWQPWHLVFRIGSS